MNEDETEYPNGHSKYKLQNGFENGNFKVAGMNRKTASYRIINRTEYKEFSVPTCLLIQSDQQDFLLCKCY